MKLTLKSLSRGCASSTLLLIPCVQSNKKRRRSLHKRLCKEIFLRKPSLTQRAVPFFFFAPPLHLSGYKKKKKKNSKLGLLLVLKTSVECQRLVCNYKTVMLKHRGKLLAVRLTIAEMDCLSVTSHLF